MVDEGPASENLHITRHPVVAESAKNSMRIESFQTHAENEHASDSQEATTVAARSLTVSERHRSPSTLQDVHTRRIATGAVSAFARTQRRRRYFFARALGKPTLPCRPPGTLGVWCLCLPGDRI